MQIAGSCRWLERKAGADLDLAAGGHRHRDGAELRSVDEAIGRTQVDFVHSVERFAAQLEIQFFGEVEVPDQREVQGLQRRAVDRVSTSISEGECGGGSEGSGTEPFGRGTRPRAEDGRAGVIGADGIFSQDGAGVGGVAEDGNRKRHAGLRLVDGRDLPIRGEQMCPGSSRNTGYRVDGAQGEAVTDIATGAFLGGKIAVVLRNGGLIHGRAKIRGVG